MSKALEKYKLFPIIAWVLILLISAYSIRLVYDLYLAVNENHGDRYEYVKEARS